MIDATQDRPLDEDAYKHQLLLLKSAHCGRPVMHQGIKQFINSLTLYHAGGRVEMIVYLAGKKDSFDSSEIQIQSSAQQTEEGNTNA